MFAGLPCSDWLVGILVCGIGVGCGAREQPDVVDDHATGVVEHAHGIDRLSSSRDPDETVDLNGDGKADVSWRVAR